MFSNNKISVFQLQILLVLDVFGTGVIILPRRAAQYAAQDAWLVIIAATAAAVFFAHVITTLSRMFPGQPFLSYASVIAGRPIAYLISLGLVVKILICVSMELRFFCEIVKQALLHDTPYAVIACALLLAGAFAASKGYETRARMAGVLILVVMIPVVTVFCIGAVSADFSNLLPLLESLPIDIARGGFLCTIAFTGLELLPLVNPYIGDASKLRRRVLWTVVFIGVIMLLITVITIGEFGPADVTLQTWPVLEMMDAAELPGSFIERQSAFMMSFWIISVFAVVNAAFFFASDLLRGMFENVFKKAGHTSYILVCIPVIYILSRLPEDIAEAERVLDFIFITFGSAYFFIIPLLLLAAAKVRRLGKP